MYCLEWMCLSSVFSKKSSDVFVGVLNLGAKDTLMVLLARGAWAENPRDMDFLWVCAWECSGLVNFNRVARVAQMWWCLLWYPHWNCHWFLLEMIPRWPTFAFGRRHHLKGFDSQVSHTSAVLAVDVPLKWHVVTPRQNESSFIWLCPDLLSDARICDVGKFRNSVLTSLWSHEFGSEVPTFVFKCRSNIITHHQHHRLELLTSSLSH